MSILESNSTGQLAASPPALGHGPATSTDRLRLQPVAFREFVALPSARALLHRGAPMKIGGRAFDLLMVLLSARGMLVRKNEIIRHVWPDTFVDEVNLRFQMAMLRKLLGRDRDLIKTVPGRGYLLIDDDYPAVASA